MAKSKSPANDPRASAAVPPAHHRKDGLRETIESIVIAFVLAFLFKTFEAEAFVFPTGSMAPTLMGMHKDLNCEACGTPYRVGASEEFDDQAEYLRAQIARSDITDNARNAAADALRALEVVSTTCPNCRYAMNMYARGANGTETLDYPTYKGDRILVAKFPYTFADPDRWDVAVFKYPQTPSENYIKRVVGLPGETIVVHGGNIYTQSDEALSIERKPPEKVRAIMQTVYDNDYVVPDLVAAGLPLRFNAIDPSAAGAWQPLEGFRSYRTDGTAGDDSWLGYQHTVPTAEDWRRYEQSGSFAGRNGVRPQLVDDFYAYNGGVLRGRHDAPDAAINGANWVGDLILECDLTVESAADDKAEAVLRLVRGGHTYDCRINVTTGAARLAIDDEATQFTTDTPIRVGATHRVALANVDCQLLLWVDGQLREFSSPATYDPTLHLPPTAEDLTPARIASRGAGLVVDHLRILRDVYYIALSGEQAQSDLFVPFTSQAKVADFMSTPDLWPEAFANMRTARFPLGADEFLMFGDNSPRSKDSRLWTERDADGRPEYYVKRDLLVGKAVFVYWPHSWNRIPGTEIPFPFFPNFARMKLVR